MDELIAGKFDDSPLWRRRIDRSLPVLIGISLVVAIGALLYFASIAARQQEQALMEQQRSYEIVTLARRLDASVAKAESSLARYVISMDKNIGRKYQDEWNSASQELAALSRGTRNDPAQAKLVRQLEQAFKERGRTLNDIALRTTYDQKSTSLGKFYEASKAQSLARITSLLEQVIEVENARLREHNVDVERAGDSVQQITTTYRLVGLVLLIAILLTAWVARAAIKERHNERRLIDEEYRRAEALEAAVAARTAELEIAYSKLQQESEDRARAEESLRQMQKMEAIGQLTGGIAHDFNNMLTVVVGGLELARRRVGDSPDVVRHIDNALDGANRASTLTRRLLAFARVEPSLPEAHIPDELILGMIELLDRAIGDQITVALDLHCDQWEFYADRHQLENALLNLAVNARDAMNGRGTLTIQTRQQRLRTHEVGKCSAGEYVCLSVIDTGCGMPPEVMARVFEPFYTTKDVGKGTGLGLSQVFGFIGQCGGEIDLISEPGTGTEVALYFPRHIASPAAQNTSSDQAHEEMDAGAGPISRDSAASDDISARHRAKRRTILVVEDDPRVLAQTRSALLELGHETICCDHPAKTVEMLDANRGVDLILSDVLMPDMTGPEMIAALPAKYRPIPVIFVTGYAGDVDDNSMFEGHLLLRKPYTLTSLKKMIAKATSRSRGSRIVAAPT